VFLPRVRRAFAPECRENHSVIRIRRRQKSSSFVGLAKEKP